jgi:TPR repeat protein
MGDFAAEQLKLLRRWEYAQANDWDILQADPFKDEVLAAIRLHDASPKEGFVQLLDFANRGSIYSAPYVAWSYAVGWGVPKDPEEAQAWYRRAFEGGSDRGLLDYGADLVSRGQIGEAEKVYEAGWQRGFVPAVYRLIRLNLRSTLPLAERLAWKVPLEWAASEGHPGARYLLSKYLIRGLFGVRGIPLGLRLLFAYSAAIFRGDEDRPIVV